jgi:radical SAM superfamily enzyme YgiQ (UPF0313 family)
MEEKSRDIIFISFDIRKDDYPSISYSIATLIASLKQSFSGISHFSFDLQHSLEEKPKESTITEVVQKKMEENIDFFKKFRFIAISLTSWSIEFCNSLLGLLDGYKGEIILGGYEVTSMSVENLMKTFPRADYFVKGFAEKALRKIMSGEYEEKVRVISEKIELSDLASPYLSGVLPLFSKKIHWESQRGCPFRCGFCEWGKATKNIISIDRNRLFAEIELFKHSSIDEINILDGTFNNGKHYLTIFKKLLEISGVRITCQAKFENLLNGDGPEFLRLCAENKERVHLEFGLQTIHHDEMDLIGRKNEIEKIKAVLKLLVKNKIDFETSIIYAIPGQTVEKFIDTIEFLLLNGCQTIRAYPLSIPKNSNLECKMEEYDVQMGKNKYNVFSVISTSSFSEDNRHDMDRIANYLIEGGLQIPELSARDPRIMTRETTFFQKELVSIPLELITPQFEKRLVDDYLAQTMSDISRDDVLQGTEALGASVLRRNHRKEFFSEIVCGNFSFEVKDRPKPEKSEEPMIQAILDKIKPNLVPRKYRCRVRLGRSGNVYIFRELQYS